MKKVLIAYITLFCYTSLHCNVILISVHANVQFYIMRSMLIQYIKRLFKEPKGYRMMSMACVNGTWYCLSVSYV